MTRAPATARPCSSAHCAFEMNDRLVIVGQLGFGRFSAQSTKQWCAVGDDCLAPELPGPRAGLHAAIKSSVALTLARMESLPCSRGWDQSRSLRFVSCRCEFIARTCTVARPTGVRPIMTTPFRAKCSERSSLRALKSGTISSVIGFDAGEVRSLILKITVIAGQCEVTRVIRSAVLPCPDALDVESLDRDG